MSKISLSIVGQNYQGYWVGSVEGVNKIGDPCVTKNILNEDLSSDPQVLPIYNSGANLRTLVNSYQYASGVGEPGSALYGIYDPSTTVNWALKAKAQANQATVYPAIPVWSVTNPYGAVTVGNDLYLINNDDLPGTNTAVITKVNTANDAYNQEEVVYEFTPEEEGWKGAGYGLSLYSNGETNYLVAVFASFKNTDFYNYEYQSSKIVMIDLTTKAVTEAEANANVSGVTVEGDYAYVTSFGGAQQAGGNPESKLEIFSLSDGEPVLTATIGVDAIPAIDQPGSDTPVAFGGDYIDVAFANGKAYVLAAHYDDYYTKYDYIIIQTTAADLQDGVFGTGAKVLTGTATPASPTFALLPDGNDLYFVDGVSVYSIDTSVDIDAVGALTQWCTAANFTLTDGETTHTGYSFNSVALVIATAAVDGTGKAVPASVTKHKHGVRPAAIAKEEEEK